MSNKERTGTLRDFLAVCIGTAAQSGESQQARDYAEALHALIMAEKLSDRTFYALARPLDGKSDGAS